MRKLFLMAALAAPLLAQTKLQMKVVTGHGQQGYDVNSTLVWGERDMLVIDPQFSRSGAYRLAAEILESKKNLTAIYVTHAHPDHFFGLAVLKQAFPNAKIVALPATSAAMKNAWPNRQKFWEPTYGNNIPGPEPVIPEDLPEPALLLEGQRLPITGGLQGDGPGNSFVQIPSLNAIVAGDVVFDHVYFGVAKDKAREDWIKVLDQIVALKPTIVVPGHQGPGAKNDLSAIAWMKQYFADWDKTVAQSKSAAEMKAAWLKSHPGLGMEFTIDQRVAAYFPDPAAK